MVAIDGSVFRSNTSCFRLEALKSEVPDVPQTNSVTQIRMRLDMAGPGSGCQVGGGWRWQDGDGRMEMARWIWQGVDGKV